MERGGPAHDAVIVVAPSQRGGAGRLTVVGLRGAGDQARARDLELDRGTPASSRSSTSARRSSTSWGSAKQPARMEGPADARSAATDGDASKARVNWLVNINRAAQFRDREIAPVTVWFVVLQIVLTLGALIAFVRFGRRTRGSRSSSRRSRCSASSPPRSSPS